MVFIINGVQNFIETDQFALYKMGEGVVILWAPQSNTPDKEMRIIAPLPCLCCIISFYANLAKNLTRLSLMVG